MKKQKSIPSRQTDGPLEDAGAAYWDMVQKCLEEYGFELPLHVAAVSVNGCVLITRLTSVKGYVEGSTIVKHDEDDGNMHMPINILIADSAGNAARVLWNSDGTRQFFH